MSDTNTYYSYPSFEGPQLQSGVNQAVLHPYYTNDISDLRSNDGPDTVATLDPATSSGGGSAGNQAYFYFNNEGLPDDDTDRQLRIEMAHDGTLAYLGSFRAYDTNTDHWNESGILPNFELFWSDLHNASAWEVVSSPVIYSYMDEYQTMKGWLAAYSLGLAFLDFAGPESTSPWEISFLRMVWEPIPVGPTPIELVSNLDGSIGPVGQFYRRVT